MASCIQVSASRTLCSIHQQFVQRNCLLLKSLRCKNYVLGNNSIITRTNVHCANLKVYKNLETSTISQVSITSAASKLHFTKHVPISRSAEKSSSYVLVQKSMNSFAEKQEIEKTKDFVKSQQTNQAQSEDPNPLNKSTPEQVERVADILKSDLPNLFTTHQDYRIYHKNLIFENHIRGTKTTTLQDYVKQLALVKLFGHLKYAYVEFQVIKLTTHHSEGTIKVRWRIKGLSGMKVFLNFWKYKVWDLKDSAMKDVEAWYDGFSIFYVKGDGLVHKHVVLKMQPDEDHELDTIKPNLAAKVA